MPIEKSISDNQEQLIQNWKIDNDVKQQAKSSIFIQKNNINEIIEKVKGDIAIMKSEIIREINQFEKTLVIDLTNLLNEHQSFSDSINQKIIEDFQISSVQSIIKDFKSNKIDNSDSNLKISKILNDEEADKRQFDLKQKMSSKMQVIQTVEKSSKIFQDHKSKIINYLQKSLKDFQESLKIEEKSYLQSSQIQNQSQIASQIQSQNEKNNFIWQYNHGDFVTYNQNLQTQIENNYQKFLQDQAQNKFQFMIKNISYSINFTQMEQENLNTQFKRKIQRVPITQNAVWKFKEKNKHWIKYDFDLTCLIELNYQKFKQDTESNKAIQFKTEGKDTSYTINFETMKQKNEETQFVRDVIREQKI